MTTRVIDANNWMRRYLESGEGVRGIFNQFYSTQEPAVVVWDGPNALKARREIYPAYKEKRNKPKEDIWIGFDQIRQVLQFTPAIQIRVPGFEADDVIAEFVRDQTDIHIHSTDKDFLSLGVPCDAKPIEGVLPQYIRLYKSVVGDPSDNIPGIPGFGQKAWNEGNPDGLMKWLHKGADYNFPARAKPVREDVLKYWKIVGFLPVQIGAEHIQIGKADLRGAEAYFERWEL